MDIQGALREKGLEFAFFLVLTVYVVLMLLELPPGRSGLVPALVVAVALVLLVYRLTVIWVPGLADAVKGIGERFEPTLADPDAIVGEEEPAEGGSIGGAFEEEITSPRDLLASVAWILAGVLAIFVFGLLVGGALYLVSFLYVAGGYTARRSLGIGLGFMAVMYGLITAFNFLVWTGVIDYVGVLRWLGA